MGKSFCISESNTCFCVKGQNSSGCSLQSLLTRLFSPVVRSSGLRTCVEAYMKNSEISSKVSLPIIVPNLNSFFTISNASRIQCFFLSNIYSPPQLREGVLRKSIILWNSTALSFGLQISTKKNVEKQSSFHRPKHENFIASTLSV